MGDARRPRRTALSGLGGNGGDSGKAAATPVDAADAAAADAGAGVAGSIGWFCGRTRDTRAIRRTAPIFFVSPPPSPPSPPHGARTLHPPLSLPTPSGLLFLPHHAGVLCHACSAAGRPLRPVPTPPVRFSVSALGVTPRGACRPQRATRSPVRRGPRGYRRSTSPRNGGVGARGSPRGTAARCCRGHTGRCAAGSARGECGR